MDATRPTRQAACRRRTLSLGLFLYAIAASGQQQNPVVSKYLSAPDLTTAAVSSAPAPRSAEAATPAHYNLRFGENPYIPSEAKSDFTGFLKPSDFPTAQYCSKCHAAVHAEWRESVHANSFRTPWYKKNVNTLADTKGVEFTRHCEGCHNPIALFTGALTQNSPVDRAFDEDGVTCMVCHSIRRVQNTKGLGSYVLGKPAVLLDEHGDTVPACPPTPTSSRISTATNAPSCRTSTAPPSSAAPATRPTSPHPQRLQMAPRLHHLR